VIGYDAAGVVVEAGSQASLFRRGDEVFYAGSNIRSGTNAEFHLVDERIVGHKPRSLHTWATRSFPRARANSSAAPLAAQEVERNFNDTPRFVVSKPHLMRPTWPATRMTGVGTWDLSQQLAQVRG
jgi:hypothetical protein